MSCYTLYHIDGSEKHENRENDRNLIPAAAKRKGHNA